MNGDLSTWQPADSLPGVPRVPPPWSLRGQAWIVVLRWPRLAPNRGRFVPNKLRPTLASPFALLMFVDYTEAPCGPYRELLFVPGSMRFEDGRRHLSISRIVVSTWDSVVNGRVNWGIPKDQADFRIEQGATDRVAVSFPSQELCALQFAAARGPRARVDSAWLPQRWMTFAQVCDGRTHYYIPHARGTMQSCRLLDWSVGGDLFGDLAGARAVTAVRVENFSMTFPIGRVVDRV